MDGLVAPVTLIVKSCNQQFDDQVISCEMNWTIRKLKQELAEVYPTKPRTDEQKLIYSGQLLHDGIVLKDILRQYEGQSTHTVHLVFTPKQMKEEKMRPSNTTSKSEQAPADPNTNTPTSATATTGGTDTSDGLRHRNVHSDQTAVPNIPQTQLPNNPFLNATLFYNSLQNGFMPPQASMPNLQTTGQSGDYLQSQQVAMQAWMQQAYVQYVNQYMNMLQLGAQATPLYAATASTAASSQAFPYFQPPSAASAPQGPQSPPPVPPADAAAAAPQEPAAQQAQRRFPNLVVDEPQENRDWLDISYFMLRVTVVLTVIYVYSSPIRCLAVLSIGLALYLYRRGVFRNQLERNLNPQNNNNNNVNNNNEAGQVAEGAEAAPGAGTSAAPQDQNRTSWLVMARTFILSFIFSLIPETPAL